MNTQSKDTRWVDEAPSRSLILSESGISYRVNHFSSSTSLMCSIPFKALEARGIKTEDYFKKLDNAVPPMIVSEGISESLRNVLIPHMQQVENMSEIRELQCSLYLIDREEYAFFGVSLGTGFKQYDASIIHSFFKPLIIALDDLLLDPKIWQEAYEQRSRYQVSKSPLTEAFVKYAEALSK